MPPSSLLSSLNSSTPQELQQSFLVSTLLCVLSGLLCACAPQWGGGGVYWRNWRARALRSKAFDRWNIPMETDAAVVNRIMKIPKKKFLLFSISILLPDKSGSIRHRRAHNPWTSTLHYGLSPGRAAVFDIFELKFTNLEVKCCLDVQHSITKNLFPPVPVYVFVLEKSASSCHIHTSAVQMSHTNGGVRFSTFSS